MYLLRAFRLLLSDLASTLVFLAVVLATKDIPLAIIAGMVFGACQIAWQLARQQEIGKMQWMSLVLVIGLGTVSLITDDPRFVMIKPSLIYIIVGIVMLRPGWQNRYQPADVMAVAQDIVIMFGFVWAGLMFLSAALNVIVALNLSPQSWAAFMSVYGIASKAGLLLFQYAATRLIVTRRLRVHPSRQAAA
jgi:intracellular septation protein